MPADEGAGLVRRVRDPLANWDEPEGGRANGDDRPAARHRLASGIVLVALALGLTAIWRWTPLAAYVHPDAALALVDAFLALPGAPLLAIGLFIMAGLVGFPVTVLIVVTAIAFGPWLGLVCSLAGASASAMITYVVGAALGRDSVRWLAGRRLDRVVRRLGDRGLLAVVIARLVPVAPFTVVNLVAGASSIRARDFALGTVLGMAPGILAVTLFTDRIRAAISDPSPDRIGVAVGIVALGASGAIALARWKDGQP